MYYYYYYYILRPNIAYVARALQRKGGFPLHIQVCRVHEACSAMSNNKVTWLIVWSPNLTNQNAKNLLERLERV